MVLIRELCGEKSVFDDTRWTTGAAELGFGDNNEVTVIEKGPPGAQHLTYYFRKICHITERQLGQLQAIDPAYQLQISLKRDDGAVVYLNGEEIRRDNMPAGSINYQTLARTAFGGVAESTFFDTSPPIAGKLHAGTHVVAVEVHQGSTISSDLSFDMGIYLKPPIYHSDSQTGQLASLIM